MLVYWSSPYSWPTFWIGVWPYVDLLGPEEVAQVVEVVVRRLGQGRAAGSPDRCPIVSSSWNTQPLVSDVDSPGTLNVPVSSMKTLRREDAGLHLGGRGDHLEGAAGRVEALDRVVVERALASSS